MKTKTPQNSGEIKKNTTKQCRNENKNTTEQWRNKNKKQAFRKKHLYDRRIILLREEIWTPITLYMKYLCHDRKVSFCY